ncbi:GNAT family N-acetyltransferase [Streptomyces oceani]|uniref:Lysine N-acyltransferase MbtK n=1 Tax=Streptomyces oceani TaxID=1075402 RepID=A0A1E7KGL0_9ACTN|nr:GNAT family N-acetyltransferase [Streptomyces oceani]OEV03082.1 acetyltransferase [Streptomyces oceani]
MSAPRPQPVFSRSDPRLGELSLRPVDPYGDAELLHRWVTHPKAVYWMLQEAEPPDVEREFLDIAAREGHDAFLGLHEGSPAFLVERYAPEQELGEVYSVRPGDLGMHFLCAPTERPLHGFTRAVIVTVMEFLFADPAIDRIVVEPDVRNTAVHTLNATVGFRIERTVPLPGKEAYLSTCTRDQYLASQGDSR